MLKRIKIIQSTTEEFTLIIQLSKDIKILILGQDKYTTTTMPTSIQKNTRIYNLKQWKNNKI